MWNVPPSTTGRALAPGRMQVVLQKFDYTLKIDTNNKILFTIIIITLSSGLSTKIIWSLCKGNRLLPFGYSKSNDKYRHRKMAKT